MGEAPAPRRPHRSRRRASRQQGAPTAAPAEVEAARPPAVPEPPARRLPRRPRPDGDHGGMRDIVGAGPSQLGVSKALRGRDVNRPTDADLAAADRDTVLVRRNWRPDPL